MCNFRRYSGKEEVLLFYWSSGAILITSPTKWQSVVHIICCENFHVMMVTVYVPPSASPMLPCDSSTVARLYAFTGIAGDFNHVSMAKSLTHSMWAALPGRGKPWIYYMLMFRKDTVALPSPVGDHNLVHLNPSYEPLVKRQLTTNRTVRRCKEEAYKTLKKLFWGHWLAGILWDTWGEHQRVYRVYHRLLQLLCWLHCSSWDCSMLPKQQALGNKVD